MLEFWQRVAECNPNHQNKVLTALDPELSGEKALFSNGRLIWESHKDGFFSVHQREITALTGCGLRLVDGKQVFCDFLSGEKMLVVCGAGHVSIPVIQMGKMLGCCVTVLEDRPVFADNARRTGADRVICKPFEQGLGEISGGKDTFFIILTRGHRYDQTCLEIIAAKEHAYIGMIGSRSRTARVKEALIEKGVDPGILERVYTPIGLDIGAETPEEIAVAIMAEIVQVKNKTGRKGGYPREILQAVLEPSRALTEKILATIVSRKGSAPREVGTKMLIYRDGTTVGTIGGGCLEADVRQAALRLLSGADSKSCLYHADMTGKDAETEGMVCGGVIDVLLEAL